MEGWPSPGFPGSICGPFKNSIVCRAAVWVAALFQLVTKLQCTVMVSKALTLRRGDYGSVWLAFPAKARRHRSGAFMRSQVRLKSSVGPLHSKSSMEVNTGTSTRSVARVRNNTASSHAAKRDSAKARALRTIGSAAFFLPRIFLGALLRANSYAPQLRSFCFPGSFPNRHDSSQRRTSATFSLGSSEQSGQLPQRAIRSMQSQLLVYCNSCNS